MLIYRKTAVDPSYRTSHSHSLVLDPTTPEDASKKVLAASLRLQSHCIIVHYLVTLLSQLPKHTSLVNKGV